MKVKPHLENSLEKLAKTEKLNKKSLFVNIEAILVLGFSKLSEEIIKNNITLGSYQLRQCLSYISEHFNKGKYELAICEIVKSIGKSKVLSLIIRSRHSGSTKYKVSVQYLPNTNDETGIEGWYCTCKTGMRTVGCFAHIASVIYYLACGKYLEMLPNPAGLLTFFFTNKAKPETSMLTQIETSEDEVYESKKFKKVLKKKPKINLVSSSE